MSHACIDSYDSNIPACLSEYWVKEVLINRLNFNGIVMSDDIFMKALSDNGYPLDAAAIKAIEAGISVIMMSSKHYSSVLEVLLERAKQSSDFALLLLEAEKKVIRFKIDCGILLPQKDENSNVTLKPATAMEQYGDIPSRLRAFDAAFSAGQTLYLNSQTKR